MARFLLSAGWDRRICVWDLQLGTLIDVCKRYETAGKVRASSADEMELVADGRISSIDYCVKRRQFAYSSMDGLVYVRRFALDGRRMTLVSTIGGHRSPVLVVRYHWVRDAWLTAAEDGVIRLWSADDFNACLVSIECGQNVQVLSVDRCCGAILAGVQRELHVYDCHSGHLVRGDVLYIVLHLSPIWLAQPPVANR